MNDPHPPVDWEEAGRLIDSTPWPEAWPVGSVKACPECGEQAFEGRDDLDYEIVYQRVPHIFYDLRGGRCTACGAQALEAFEMLRIEQRLGMDPNHFPPQVDFEAKVAQFGSGSLGTYWPKDVRRLLNIKAGQRVSICVLDKNTVRVRFE